MVPDDTAVQIQASAASFDAPAGHRYGAVGESISDRVVEILRQDILDGSIAPGQRLVEGTLADQYGVSRGPVRVALMALVERGLVIRSARRETRAIELTPSDVHEVYDFRVSLELFAVRAMQRIGSVAVAPLSNALSNLSATLAEGCPAVDRAIADVTFHRVLLSLARNRYLDRAWAALEDRLILIVSGIQRGETGESEIMLMHSDILHALERADWPRAEAAVRKHGAIALDALLHHTDTGGEKP